MTLSVIGIVGLSNSGKTTVATALIQRLVARGYRVAAIKHAFHGHQVDRAGTDSARLMESGAARVIVSSPGQVTSITRTPEDTPLDAIVASLENDYDVVIAEGFKDSSVPKVLVQGEEPMSPPRNVIATVGERQSEGDVPSYHFQEMDALAQQVMGQVLRGPGSGPSVSLIVNGVRVPLGPFPVGALAGVIHGFLTALNDVPSNPERIHVVLDSPAPPRVEGGPQAP